MNLPIPQQLGHYRITSLIGAGGMGEVYLADDTKLARRVAIKILPEHFSRDSEAKRRMLREARAVAALDHPNVCTIYEVGEYQDRPFIVMQYVEGETLYDRMQQSRLTLSECLDFGMQVAAALDEAHSHGIVHRDIKPLNIVITPRGQVKVLDFGLARYDSLSEGSTDLLSRPGLVTGTAPYMSPEQLRGSPLDGRSDIFSLGVVLYEMATGRRPFDRESTVSTITAILFEEPPPLDGDELAPLAPIVRRALAKEPSRRFPTAALLLEALQAARERPRGRTRRTRTSDVDATKIRSEKVPTPARARIDSLAVLPSTSAGLDIDREYLVYGLTEGIVNALSHVRRLRVIAPSTMARFAGKETEPRAVGRELNVAAIVDVRAGVDSDRLTAVVKLIATADGATLWSSEYTRAVREIGSLAEAIATDVGDQVRTRGSSGVRRPVKKKRAADAEAHQLYLKGRFQWIKRHPEAVKQAMNLFQQAVEQDPMFALPYAGLADSFVMLGFMQALPPRDILPRAKAAAQRAIELDPTLADPHATLGYAAAVFEWDWDTAVRELEESMRLNPNYPWAPHWLGLLMCARGRFRRGTELVELAVSLDPLSPIINVGLAIPPLLARRWDEAVARLRAILETETAFAPGHYYLALALEQRGDLDEAIQHMLRLVEIAGPAPIYLGALAHAYGLAGRVADAERVLEQLRSMSAQRYVSPFNFTIAYAGLGRNDEALEALEQALEEHNAWLWFMPIEKRFDELRRDPRFAPLVESHGLPVRISFEED